MTEGIKASRVSKSRPLPPNPPPYLKIRHWIPIVVVAILFSWSTWYFIIVTHITRGLHLVANIILNFHVLKNQQRNPFLCSGAKGWNCVNFVKCALHVSKSCYIPLTNIHSFVVQTKQTIRCSEVTKLDQAEQWDIHHAKQSIDLRVNSYIFNKAKVKVSLS